MLRGKSHFWKSSLPTPKFQGVADSALCAVLVQLERRVTTAAQRSVRQAKTCVDLWLKSIPISNVEPEVDARQWMSRDSQRQGVWVHCIICQ